MEASQNPTVSASQLLSLWETFGPHPLPCKRSCFLGGFDNRAPSCFPSLLLLKRPKTKQGETKSKSKTFPLGLPSPAVVRTRMASRYWLFPLSLSLHYLCNLNWR